jgi:hypothetical protein
MKVGEKRWFEWGDEPVGKVTIWTIDKDGSVRLLGHMDRVKAVKRKLIFECPFP